MVNGKTMISLASSLKTTAQTSAQPAKGAAAERFREEVELAGRGWTW